MSENVEHVLVVVEHVRDELANPAFSSKADELLQEQCGGAAVLILVRDGEGHFRPVGIRSQANEATDCDQSFAVFVLDRHCQPDVIAEIELGEATKIVRGKRRDRMEKPAINATSGQPPERDSKALFVIGPDGAYAYRSAVAKLRVSAKVGGARHAMDHAVSACRSKPLEAAVASALS